MIDVQSSEEFKKFHTKGAFNYPLDKLSSLKDKAKSYKDVALYSNGTAHAVQGQILLKYEGMKNILVLNDDLNEFLESYLKLVSLKDAPTDKIKINQYIDFFNGFIYYKF